MFRNIYLSCFSVLKKGQRPDMLNSVSLFMDAAKPAEHFKHVLSYLVLLNYYAIIFVRNDLGITGLDAALPDSIRIPANIHYSYFRTKSNWGN